jgi:hypothetical protein
MNVLLSPGAKIFTFVSILYPRSSEPNINVSTICEREGISKEVEGGDRSRGTQYVARENL